ncbi:hypothetical protein PFICI_00466 [Pestalotiopsis fici W106-1]|uniref:Uncharacterized protein n=1 Tax=Pestalotiopsis fici (strain W106-1 / CGMCC3.15140) TaxID=1229662 RepID=W3XKQ2_PESFW|nr:uncharacterized protein PFICI_00466 [Pestalotiopsis fici W106-1]ETS86638.1 hypothetical protein PFICI_00466 [Pestalotiopsis fici W106-1]
MFMLTSVPIHLVFNSTIFEINYLGAAWTTVLASESFVNGAPYYLPGASLLSGRPSLLYDKSRSGLLASIAANASKWTKIDIDTCNKLLSTCQPMTQYKDIVVVMTSDNTTGFTLDGWIPSGIFDMATNFNQSLGLDMAESGRCYGVQHTESFVRKNLNELGINGNTLGNYGDFWKQRMPLDSPNSLWYATSCSRDAAHDDGTGCRQKCNGLDLRASTVNFQSTGFLQPPPLNLEMPDGVWPNGPPPSLNDTGCPVNETMKDLNGSHTVAVLNPSYCLAEPSQSCMIGILVPLLIFVTICLLLKTLTALVVVFRPHGRMLVTPGDAIASFIRYPDPTTVGRVTLGQPSLGLEVLQLVRQLEGWQYDSEAVFLESVLWRPRPWRKAVWSGYASVRRSAWLTTYLLIGGIFSVACCLFIIAFRSYGLDGDRSFHPVGRGNVAPLGRHLQMLEAILIANAPQLMLTEGYFSYNSIFTRLVLAREWFSYTVAARPLRVTDPRGEQVSTYRLQLPYSYSVPLLALSIVLHWMVSNTFYIVVIYGGFYQTLYPVKDFTLTGVPPDIYVRGLQMQIGYSTLSILLVVVITTVLAPVPLVLGLRRIKNSNMVGFPSNSIVMSAVCHVSTVTAFSPTESGNRPPRRPSEERDVSSEQATSQEYQLLPRQSFSQGGTTIELSDLASGTNGFSSDDLSEEQDEEHTNNSPEALLPNSGSEWDSDEGDARDVSETAIERQEGRDRLRISRSLLRWGEMKMPPSFHEQWADLDDPVGHLSFGTELQWQGEPKEGRLYV